MVRGPATTQTHWINSAAGASPPSTCLVGLSAATGSDRCHAVTHNVPIQAQHPFPAPRRCAPHSQPSLSPCFPRAVTETAVSHRDADSPKLACTGPGLVVASMGVAWTSEVTGYPHPPGTQGRWEQHPAVTFAKVTPPPACKHGRGGG